MATKIPRQSCMLIGIRRFLAWCWIARDTTAVRARGDIERNVLLWVLLVIWSQELWASKAFKFSVLLKLPLLLRPEVRVITGSCYRTGWSTCLNLGWCQSGAQIETLGMFAGNDPYLGDTFLGNEVKRLTSCHWTEDFFQRQCCQVRYCLLLVPPFDQEQVSTSRTQWWALFQFFKALSLHIWFCFTNFTKLHKGPWGHRSCQQILHACPAACLQQASL